MHEAIEVFLNCCIAYYTQPITNISIFDSFMQVLKEPIECLPVSLSTVLLVWGTRKLTSLKGWDTMMSKSGSRKALSISEAMHERLSSKLLLQGWGPVWAVTLPHPPSVQGEGSVQRVTKTASSWLLNEDREVFCISNYDIKLRVVGTDRRASPNFKHRRQRTLLLPALSDVY